jgi:hypothetical protein
VQQTGEQEGFDAVAAGRREPGLCCGEELTGMVPRAQVMTLVVGGKGNIPETFTAICIRSAQPFLLGGYDQVLNHRGM